MDLWKGEGMANDYAPDINVGNIGGAEERGKMNFTINLPPVTKKNSQRIVTNSRTGRPFILPSKQYKQYEADCAVFMPKEEMIIDPVNIEAVFYMPTHRAVDLVNLQEALLDVLVAYRVIEDDNSKIVVSMDGSRVSYDKERPRTEVRITKVKS